MPKKPFWTEPRFMGFALLLECLLAVWGFASSLQDEPGTCISRLLPRAPLRLIAKHRTRWTWSARLAISEVVLTRLVLTLLTSLFWDAGDHRFSLPGMVAFGFGTVLWLIQPVSRLRIDVWAAQKTSRTGVILASSLAMHTACGGCCLCFHRAGLLSPGRLRGRGASHASARVRGWAGPSLSTTWSGWGCEGHQRCPAMARIT